MTQTDAAPMNILIVDDTPENLLVLTNLLTRQGYLVRPAISGQLALKTIQKTLPDLILLDIMLPGMSGYEVCKRLKADERTRAIPVIFLSVLGEVWNKVQAFAVGGVDYITKPFQTEEVLARIQAHLTIRQLQRQLHEQNLRFQLLSEATFEGILILQATGPISDVNQTFEQMFGYHRAEIIGKQTLEFIAPDFRQRVSAHIQMADGQLCEAAGVRPDGTLFPLEIRVKTLAYQGAAVKILALQDISRQRAVEAEKAHLQHENRALKSTIKDRYRFGDMIGKSPVMQELYNLIVNAAASQHNISISGETGTGKELVARTIHAMSARRQQAFVVVNCAAITESLFEREFFGHRKSAFTGADRDQPGFFDAAHHGTLFLDEVGELSLMMQGKLLRAIETGEYTPVGDNRSKKADIRIVAATNKNLLELVDAGLIRRDFFYRIHVIEIALPPLRERKEDIPLLVEHFLKQYGAHQEPLRLPAQIAELLDNYDWPGNVRELQNQLKRYLLTKHLTLGVRQAETLTGPPPAPAAADDPETGLHEAVAALERRMLAAALTRHRWHKGKTAAALGIPRKTLQRKMARYGLQGPS